MLRRLRLCPHRRHKHGFERRLQGAKQLAELLRRRVTLPAEMEKQGNWQDAAVLLPRVSCAFHNCSWSQQTDEAAAGRERRESKEESKFSRFGNLTLWDHILQKRKDEIQKAASVADDDNMIYDTYREARR